MYDERVRTNNAKDKQSQGRTDLGWTPSGDKRLVYDIAVMYIFNENRKCCNHQSPDSVYLNR